MKQFEITFVSKENNIFEKIEADDLVELLSKLILIIIQTQQKLHKVNLQELESLVNNDDIPF